MHADYADQADLSFAMHQQSYLCGAVSSVSVLPCYRHGTYLLNLLNLLDLKFISMQIVQIKQIFLSSCISRVICVYRCHLRAIIFPLTDYTDLRRSFRHTSAELSVWSCVICERSFSLTDFEDLTD